MKPILAIAIAASLAFSAAARTACAAGEIMRSAYEFQQQMNARSRANNRAMNNYLVANHQAQCQDFLQNAGNMNVRQMYQGLLQIDPSGGAMAAQFMQTMYMDRMQKYQSGTITPQELRQLRELIQLFGN